MANFLSAVKSYLPASLKPASSAQDYTYEGMVKKNFDTNFNAAIEFQEAYQKASEKKQVLHYILNKFSGEVLSQIFVVMSSQAIAETSNPDLFARINAAISVVFPPPKANNQQTTAQLTAADDMHTDTKTSTTRPAVAQTATTASKPTTINHNQPVVVTRTGRPQGTENVQNVKLKTEVTPETENLEF